MNISVIIPAYNDLPGVLTALNSLHALAEDNSRIEYLVQDDASPDVHYQALIPAVLASMQRNESNVGFAANCNMASQRANGDILLFVNQDVWGMPELSHGWDTVIRGIFESEPRIGIVGPRLLFPNGTVQSAGGRFDAAKQPFHPCLGWSEINHPDAATSRDMPWVTGAMMAVRRWVWETLNGFCTDYVKGYFEDVDLCCRAAERGIRVHYTADTTFIHNAGSSGGNPHFMANAKVFHDRWVATNKIQSDVSVVMERFWA